MHFLLFDSIPNHAKDEKDWRVKASSRFPPPAVRVETPLIGYTLPRPLGGTHDLFSRSGRGEVPVLLAKSRPCCSPKYAILSSGLQMCDVRRDREREADHDGPLVI